MSARHGEGSAKGFYCKICCSAQTVGIEKKLQTKILPRFNYPAVECRCLVLFHM